MLNNKIFRKNSIIRPNISKNSTPLASGTTLKFTNHKWENSTIPKNFKKIPLKKSSITRPNYYNGNTISNMNRKTGQNKRIVISGGRIISQK